jgi:NAD(P)H-flavin reductase
VFLARPISVAGWRADTRITDRIENRNHSSRIIRFLIAKQGIGTEELASLIAGEQAELTGPLGNGWAGFVPEILSGPLALIAGGIGMAPLRAFAAERAAGTYDFYAGFKTLDPGLTGLLDGLNTAALILATEDGSGGHKGRILDILEPATYQAVYACGPEPMLKAVAACCKAAGVPCFISMERRMACGVGACLGCTVRTIHGNRRCCADGPIFRAEEILLDD